MPYSLIYRWLKFPTPHFYLFNYSLKSITNCCGHSTFFWHILWINTWYVLLEPILFVLLWFKNPCSNISILVWSWNCVITSSTSRHHVVALIYSREVTRDFQCQVCTLSLWLQSREGSKYRAFTVYIHIYHHSLFLDLYPWLPVCCWDVEVFVSLR